MFFLYIIQTTTKFKWTQEKYEEILLQICMEVYGPTQGKALFDFVIGKYLTKRHFPDLDDKYIDFLPEANVDISYLIKIGFAMREDFYTSKPEVRK